MIDIRYNHTVSSTNDLAMECDSEWTLFIAEEQTKGRGQRGNSWESEVGRNLTFSLLVAPDFMQASEQFYISKIVSLSVAYLLEDLDISPKIKWPNDIYVGDEKICGILIENVISSSGAIVKSVVGVGLNVNQESFKSDAPNPISIFNLLGCETNRNEVLNSFALHFTKLYNYLSEGEKELIDREYIKYLYKYGHFYNYRDKESTFEGKIVEVMPQGELIIERRDSSRSSYLFKEVEYIL